MPFINISRSLIRSVHQQAARSFSWVVALTNSDESEIVYFLFTAYKELDNLSLISLRLLK